jgi:hypothetical protein
MLGWEANREKQHVIGEIECNWAHVLVVDTQGNRGQSRLLEPRSGRVCSKIIKQP